MSDVGQAILDKYWGSGVAPGAPSGATVAPTPDDSDPTIAQGAAIIKKYQQAAAQAAGVPAVVPVPAATVDNTPQAELANPKATLKQMFTTPAVLGANTDPSDTRSVAQRLEDLPGQLVDEAKALPGKVWDTLSNPLSVGAEGRANAAKAGELEFKPKLTQGEQNWLTQYNQNLTANFGAAHALGSYLRGPMSAVTQELAGALNDPEFQQATVKVNTGMTPSGPSAVVPPPGDVASGVDAKANNILSKVAGGDVPIDTGQGIVGSKQTGAQAATSSNLGINRLEAALRKDPDTQPLFVQRDAENLAARNAQLQAIVGTPEDIAAKESARDASMAGVKDKVFAAGNTAAVDPTPVLEKIDSLLQGDAGQRSAVAGPLQDIKDKLIAGYTKPETPPPEAIAQLRESVGAEPTPLAPAQPILQTSPQQLYGIRSDIADRLTPLARGTQNYAPIGSHYLRDVQQSIDDLIEAGAKGYKSQYMEPYEQQSRPITGMKYLQSQANNVTDANGNVSFSKLDGMIKRIENSQAKSGLQKADAVSDEQLDQLRKLRDDMRLDSAGKPPPGTKPMDLSTLGQNPLLRGAAWATTGTVPNIVHAITSPATVFPSYLAGKYVRNQLENTNLATKLSLANKLLNPELAPSVFKPQ